MKKIILLASVFMISLGAKAQFYIDVNGGYGFGWPSNVLGESAERLAVNGVLESDAHLVASKNLMGSLGQGANIQLTPGYMINDYIGFELGISYFIGAKKTMSSSVTSLNYESLDFENEPLSHSITTASSNQIRILPTIIISTGKSNKFSGYAKLGIVMPVFGSTKAVVDSLSFDTYDAVNKKLLYNNSTFKVNIAGSPSVGFRGAVGMNYNITDHLSVFGELYATSLNIKTKSQTIYYFERNGEDKTDALPAYKAVTEYVDKLDENSNNASYNPNYDLGKPLQELFSKRSFSQLGIQFGIKYTF